MSVTNPPEPAIPSSSFRAFSLSAETLAALDAMGYQGPTEVQARALPIALSGRDLIVQSRTGTGKTAAFGIRIAEAADPSDLSVQALVLTPARELTLQVHKELARIGEGRAVKCVPVYGGRPIERQIEELRRGAQSVVGTPGRILDHLRRGTLHFERLRILVLDEADLMLDMGFEKEMRQILDHLPSDRQTLLFSATIPRAIEAIAQRYLKNPEKLLLSEDFVYVKEVAHEYYITNRMQKERNLYNLLEREDPASSMIFCNTREETRQVANYLARKGLPVAMLSSDLSQARREKVMGRFRRGELRHLVATDVAARGIDIEGLSHVFIFSAPSSPDQYVHRAGRTGRIGRSGKAISLVAAQDLVNFNKLVRVNSLEAIERDLPTEPEVAARKSEHLLSRLRESALATAPEELMELEPVARHIAGEADRDTLLAMLLQEHFSRPPIDLDTLPEETAVEPPRSSAQEEGSGEAHKRRRRRRRRR
ncbi:MAG TPA: DEAD/DEAH box helicase [Candidatus Polarisedimenticolia bacterium]|nr:DEAD/DEAH box helicase [Candidatus Polarisedimenticolia bacterium]